MRVIVAEGEEEKRLSYRLRFNTMCEDLGWLPVKDYAAQEEWDEYDVQQSMPFLATDASGSAIGTSRLILPGGIPFPVEKHFDLYPRELIEAIHGKMEFCVEVSRFVIPQNPFFKKHEITLTLCKAMIKRSIAMGVTHMFVSADHRFFRLLKIIGFHLTEIGEPKFYLGSKTIPGILPLWNLSSILKNEKPQLYEYLMTSDKPVEEMASV